MARSTTKRGKPLSDKEMQHTLDDLRQSMCGQGDLGQAVRANQLWCELTKRILGMSDRQMLELEIQTSDDGGPSGGQPVLKMCVGS